MQINADTLLQIGVQLAAIAACYVRLKTDIAVIQTKLAYIEKALRMSQTKHGDL